MASLSTPDSPLSEDGSTRHFCKWIGCERVYDTVGQLGKHILEVHVSRVSAADPTSGRCHWANCPREQKPFSTKMKLIMHLRSHTGEKPYLCSFVGCTKRFSRMDILTKHMRSHAHHNPFACEVAGCTRRFPDEASLQQHLQSHPWTPQASTLNTLLGRRLAPTMNSEPVMADNQVVSLPTLQIRPPSPLPIQLLPPLSVSTTNHSTMEWSSRPSLSAHSHRPQGFGHISGDTTPIAMSAPPSPPLPSLPFHFVKTIDSSRTGDMDNHAKRMRTSRSETDLPSNWSGAASSTFPFKASSFKASPTQPSSNSHPFSVLSLAVPSSHMPIRRPVTSFSRSNTEVIIPIPQSVSSPSGLSSLAGGSNTRYERKPMSIQSFSSSTSTASSPLSSDLPTPSRQNIKQDDLELLYFFAEHSSQPKGSSISMSVNSVLCNNDDNDASYNKQAAPTKTLRQSRSEPTLPTYQFPTQPLHPQPAW